MARPGLFARLVTLIRGYRRARQSYPVRSVPMVLERLEDRHLTAVFTGVERPASVIKELVLLCCHYNPITGKYGALVLTVLRVLGAATVLLLAFWIVSMCRRDPRHEPSTEAG